ncbi:hypothetical protein B0H19DRAFT_1382384 [Mycena capillaripes]|nr:hypothetical protein B0H19DRAFT_1382384 [Mycena capillaripes]
MTQTHVFFDFVSWVTWNFSEQNACYFIHDSSTVLYSRKATRPPGRGFWVGGGASTWRALLVFCFITLARRHDFVADDVVLPSFPQNPQASFSGHRSLATLGTWAILDAPALVLHSLGVKRRHDIRRPSLRTRKRLGPSLTRPSCALFITLARRHDIRRGRRVPSLRTRKRISLAIAHWATLGTWAILDAPFLLHSLGVTNSSRHDADGAERTTSTQTTLGAGCRVFSLAPRRGPSLTRPYPSSLLGYTLHAVPGQPDRVFVSSSSARAHAP